MELASGGRADLEQAVNLLGQLERLELPCETPAILEPVNELVRLVANAEGDGNLLSRVHPEAQVRETAEALVREAHEVRTRFLHSRRIYAVLGSLDQTTLDPLARRATMLTRQDMRRAGVELDQSQRDHVRGLRDQLVDLEQAFSRTIREDVRHIQLSGSEELRGLPPDYVASHPPQHDGTIEISTRYPDYYPFMQYAASESARRRLLHEFYNRAVPANVEVLQRILVIRKELASSLGYASWADYVTEDRMVGSARKAAAFLEQVADAARARVRSELETLLALKKRDDPSAQTIGLWESLYYQQRVRSERLAFDARSARPYFAYEAVQEALLELTSELFGLTFIAVEDPLVWHPSVQTFDVSMDGEPVGRISLDMHPRPGKYTHAMSFPRRRGVGGRQLPHVVLVCNFADRSAQSQPGLLDHSEVVTFFHEFGHLVHALARGRVPWARLTDPSELDFIEAPSQLLEEWIYDVAVLRRFARHVETGEPIPEKLVQDLQSARDFGRALYAQWILFRSMVSLVLHERQPSELDATQLVFELAHRYLPYELPAGTHFEASFDHLTSYSATYYTYLWSQAIAKDLLTAFNTGLLDRNQTRRYRDLVLAPGGSRPAAELVADFLGRPYSFEALAKWLSSAPS